MEAINAILDTTLMSRLAPMNLIGIDIHED